MKTPSVIAYRLMRHRRLVLLSVSIATSAVFVNFYLSGSFNLFAFLLALGLPVAHVLRYPGVWSETVSVSLLFLAVTLVAGLGYRHGHAGNPSFAILLLVLGFCLFLGLVVFFGAMIGWGDEKAVRLRNAQNSHLDIASLRDAILPRPDTENPRSVYGAVNGDGFFSYSSKPKPTSSNMPQPDRVEVSQEPMLCKIVRDDEDSFEMITVLPDTQVTSVSRYSFASKGTGTRVTVEEYGIPVTPYLRFGMWIEDFFADCLTCDIDFAEGRPNRSTRLSQNRLLIVDIAKLFPTNLEDPGPRS